MADCDDIFFDPAVRVVYVIGGGRRVSDRAGDLIAHDQAGGLEVFSVNDRSQFAKSTSISLPPHTRTGLFVPERHAVYVAVPVQDGKDAEIREYMLP